MAASQVRIAAAYRTADLLDTGGPGLPGTRADLSGPVVLVQFALFLVIGVALFAHYLHAPPVHAFERADRVFAHFTVDQLPPGVLGLVLGAVFAAAMSTLSSSLSSSATAVVHDLVGARAGGSRLALTRWLTGLFAAAQIAVALAGPALTDSVVNGVLAIAGFTTGIILGVFVLGTWAPRVDGRAALVGMVAGLSLTTGVAFGTTLAWPYFAVVGAVCTALAGWLASLVLPPQPGGGQTRDVVT